MSRDKLKEAIMTFMPIAFPNQNTGLVQQLV